MNSQKNVGLIECNSSAMPFTLDRNSREKGFQLKKVLVKKDMAEYATENYPKAEIVRDLDSIIADETIELVIFYGSKNGYLEDASLVLRAGKQVRLM